jgi:hypothetical protein
VVLKDGSADIKRPLPTHLEGTGRLPQRLTTNLHHPGPGMDQLLKESLDGGGIEVA